MKKRVLMVYGLCVMITFDTYSQTLERKTGAGFTFEGVKTGTHGFVDVDNDGDLDLVIAGDSSKTKNFSLYKNEKGTGFSDFLSSSSSQVTTGKATVQAAQEKKYLISQYSDALTRYFLAKDSIMKNITADQRIRLAADTVRTLEYINGSTFTSIMPLFNIDTLWSIYNRYPDGTGILRVTLYTSGGIPLYKSTALAKQDSIIDANQNGILSSYTTKGFQNASLFFGDIENDGYVDMFITGSSRNGIRGYKNNAGIFSKGNYGFPDSLNVPIRKVLPLINANLGDYDNDGDLDAFINWSISIISGRPLLIESDVYNRKTSLSAQVIKSIQPKLAESSNSLGDYDKDGFIDYFVTGKDSLGDLYANLYQNVLENIIITDSTTGDSIVYKGKHVRNDTIINGPFVREDIINIYTDTIDTNDYMVTFIDTVNFRSFQQQQSLVGYYHGTSQFVDVDNDGDLDLFTAGETDDSSIARLYYNEDGFTRSNSDSTSFMGVHNAISAYGDYDNDGDLDIFLSGETENGSNFSAIYKNTNGEFTSSYTFLRNTLKVESANFADIDKDNDLDFFITGTDNGVGVSELYINNNTSPNTKPTTPTVLKAIITDYNRVAFMWDHSTDTETPIEGMTYNIYIGSSTNKDNIRNSYSITEGTNNGYRKINRPGDIRNNVYFIQDLDTGVYKWSVQAIDGSLGASTWATEQTFTVTGAKKRNLHVGFTTPNITKLVTDAPFTISVTTNSTLPSNFISYSISDRQVATITGATVTPKKEGLVIITALVPETSNYYGSLAFASLEIRKNTQTITFTTPQNVACNAGTVLLNGSSSSTFLLAYTSSDTTVAKVNGNTLSIRAVGSTVITASQSGNDTYYTAEPVSQNIIVGKVNQTISFTAPSTATVGTTTITLNATASSGLSVFTYTSSDISKLTIVGNVATTKASGTSTITVYQTGNTCYNAATASSSITISAVTPISPPITSITENKDIAIYPNPSSHFIHINPSKSLGNGIKTYRLVTIKGQEVLKGSFTSSISIDVKYQKTGTYILTIGDSEGNILQQSHVIISQ